MLPNKVVFNPEVACPRLSGDRLTGAPSCMLPFPSPLLRAHNTRTPLRVTCANIWRKLQGLIVSGPREVSQRRQCLQTKGGGSGSPQRGRRSPEQTSTAEPLLVCERSTSAIASSNSVNLDALLMDHA